ncbi:MAG TPA: hypothetical protein VF794_00050 [Archangium sp.]|uniref:hypothetical protein n=1 Tax=Archangium sp. TaxID=1872627 RepID=UPI002ED85007
MKSILDRIEQKKSELAQSPFLSFIQDSAISARKRFAFVPCIAPFAMGYTDINKFILRDDASADPLQQVINTHTREEDSHWRMYLTDLRTLNMNVSMDMANSLKMLWGDHCRMTRQLVYELSALVIQYQDPRMRLLMVEAIEGTAEVAFEFFTKAASEFEKQTGRKLHYFGMTHEEMEANHAISKESSEDLLSTLELSAQEEQQVLEAVDRVYAHFGMMFDELLAYALLTGQFQMNEISNTWWLRPTAELGAGASA